MPSEIDRFPVKELPNRYNINRSVLYTRLEKLNIKTIKEKNKSFIDGESLKLLDNLNDHLKNGGKTNDFLDQTDKQTDKTDKPDKNTKPYENRDLISETNQTDKPDRQTQQTEQLIIPGIFKDVINATLDLAESRRTGLNDLRDLQEIADQQWFLPTGRLASIIGKS
ncbi:MAG: hypothetical protein ACOC04_01515, partial [Halothece sp.]